MTSYIVIFINDLSDLIAIPLYMLMTSYSYMQLDLVKIIATEKPLQTDISRTSDCNWLH